MSWVFAAMLMVLGTQLLLLGPWWLGGALVILAVLKGQRSRKLPLVVAAILGLTTAGYELQATRQPPVRRVPYACSQLPLRSRMGLRPIRGRRLTGYRSLVGGRLMHRPRMFWPL